MASSASHVLITALQPLWNTHLDLRILIEKSSRTVFYLEETEVPSSPQTARERITQRAQRAQQTRKVVNIFLAGSIDLP